MSNELTERLKNAAAAQMEGVRLEHPAGGGAGDVDAPLSSGAARSRRSGRGRLTAVLVAAALVVAVGVGSVWAMGGDEAPSVEFAGDGAEGSAPVPTDIDSTENGNAAAGVVTAEYLNPDGPTLVVVLTTWCPHCHELADLLRDKAAAGTLPPASKLTLVFDGPADQPGESVLDDYSDLAPYFGRVITKPSAEFAADLGLDSYPSTRMYAADGALVQAVDGFNESALQALVGQFGGLSDGGVSAPTAVAQQFIAFMRNGAADASAARATFAESGSVAMGGVDRTWRLADLTTRAFWRRDVSGGTVDVVDRLAAGKQFNSASQTPTGSCADMVATSIANAAVPSVWITPLNVDSCLDWFAIGLTVDAGRVTAVSVHVPEP